MWPKAQAQQEEGSEVEGGRKMSEWEDEWVNQRMIVDVRTDAQGAHSRLGIFQGCLGP